MKRRVLAMEPVPRLNKLWYDRDNSQPAQQRVELIYSDWVSFNPGAGLIVPYVFRVNGIYDPNFTAAGHQPAGFDQYMDMYNLYTVLGSVIKVTYYNTASQQQIVGISVLPSTTTIPDQRRIIENGNTKWTTIGTPGSGQEVRVLSHQCDVAKYSGQNIYSDDIWSATGGSNPTSQLYYHVWGVCVDGVTDTLPINIAVEIRYDVCFRRRVKNILS